MKTVKAMGVTLQIEEAAFTLTGIYFLTQHSLGLPIWAWIPLFLSPDLSMLGYLFGPRVGAYTYNLFHHRAVALIITAAAFYLNQPVFLTIGILLFAHSSFDRMMGYGLKYDDSFNHTSLGGIGKQK